MLLNHLNLFASFFAADMEDAEAWEYGGIGCHGTLGLAAQAVEGGYMAPELSCRVPALTVVAPEWVLLPVSCLVPVLP